jgi:putative flippase GtrA
MRRVVHFLRRPADDRALGQMVRYVIAAGVGYVLAIAFYALSLEVGVPPYPAIVITFVLNGLFNFAVIRAWAFPSSGRPAHQDLTRFCIVAAGSLVINYGSFAVLYSLLGLPATLAQAMAIAIAAPFGFFANRLWSFRATPASARRVGG